MSTHSNNDIPDSWDDDEIDNNPTLLEIQIGKSIIYLLQMV